MPAYLVTTPQGSPAPLKSHLPPVSSSVPLSIPELLCKILRRHTLFFTAFPDFNNTKPQTSAACYVSNRSIKKGGMSRTFPIPASLLLPFCFPSAALPRKRGFCRRLFHRKIPFSSILRCWPRSLPGSTNR